MMASWASSHDHCGQGKVGYVIKMDKMFKLFRLEMLQMGQKTVENGFRGQFAEDVQDEWTVAGWMGRNRTDCPPSSVIRSSYCFGYG